MRHADGMERVVRGVVLLVAVAALVTALAWVFQRRLIYLPDRRDVPPAGSVLPGAVDVTLTTEDGLELGAWFLPAVPRDALGSVLVLNGNAGNRADRAPLARALSREGLHVLLFDYRGYGGNPGTPTADGLLADARAALTALRDRPETDPRRATYLGESLGAAVAVALAVEQPPHALALRSPFPSLAEIGRLHYPFLPVGWLLKDRYDVAGQIGRVDAPVLVVAGGADGIVPAASSRAVYDAAGEPKRWVLVDGAGHNDAALGHGARLVEAVTELVRGADTR